MENENNIYKCTVFFFIAISIMNIICNLLIGFPLQMNIKWCIMGSYSLIAAYFIMKNKYVQILSIIMFLIAIMIIIPMAFFEQGGVGILIAIYIVALVVTITFLINGSTRYILIGILTLLLCTLTFLPGIISDFDKYYIYPQDKRLGMIDSLLQLLFIIVATASISIIFANEWKKGKDSIKIYAQELEAKNRKLEWLANHDDLTKVYARNYLFQVLPDMNNENAHLMIIDIDDFKKINDTYGHVIGDKVLKEVAGSLLDNEERIVARFGGDEFIVVFEHENEKTIEMYINSFNESLSNIEIPDVKVSVSGGVTKIDTSKNLYKTIAMADELLYMVKRSGKNNIKLVY